MSDVLCIYYSRSGYTRRAMKEIAEALGAEIVAVDDGIDRYGFMGYMRAGMSAMRESTAPLNKFETAKPLETYKLVIVGTPVWAGRCSSPIRGLLKRRGLELRRVAYVITRSGARRCESVYDQMDFYTAKKHLFAVSLRGDDVSYIHWRDDFITAVRRYLEEERDA